MAAGLPMPWSLVTALAGRVLSYWDSAVALTGTVTVQVPPAAATVAPDSSSLFGDETVSTVAVPLVPLKQVTTGTVPVATRLAEGNVSVNAVPVNATPPLLVMTIFRVEVAPTGTVLGVNDLATLTGALTVSCLWNDGLLRPRVLPMAPAVTVFV